MKTATHLLAALGLGLFLAACGDDDDAATPPSSAELEGRWYLRQSEIDGTTKIDASIDAFDTTITVDEDTVYTGTDYYADFKAADSSFEIRQPGVDPADFVGDYAGLLGGDGDGGGDGDSAEVTTGKWTLSGTTLTTISSGDDTLKWTATLSGGALVLQLPIDTASSFEVGTFGKVDMEIDALIKGTFRK